jgi:uncharacterized iron-regulated membrane protein
MSLVAFGSRSSPEAGGTQFCRAAPSQKIDSASMQINRILPDYRTIWRWHFYAGLFCIPIVCFLAITGAIYLFNPQVVAWLDQPYDALKTVQSAPPSQSVITALTANPGWTLHDYQLPLTSHSAAQVIIGRNGVERRVYIDRGNLKILKTIGEEDRPMRIIFHLHGELLMGNRGSMIVELAASWAIVLVLTGIYLWWPRGTTGLAGVLYPRLGAGGRRFWRDMHAVTAIWISAFLLFMLVSGLPWAATWGGYLKDIRNLTGTAVIRQDWTTGTSSEIATNKAKDAASMAGMPGMPGMASMNGNEPGISGTGSAASLAQNFAPLDRAANTMASLHLAPPVMVSPPSKPNGLWEGRSDAENRLLRVVVKLDPNTGAVVSRTNFSQLKIIDRLVAIGVAAHIGQLFGWLNQLLGVLIALSLLVICASATVMWWQRRAVGVLGAPIPTGAPEYSAGLLAIIVILGVLLPLFGVSLVLVALAERLVLRRMPAVRNWLGLRVA